MADRIEVVPESYILPAASVAHPLWGTAEAAALLALRVPTLFESEERGGGKRLMVPEGRPREEAKAILRGLDCVATYWPEGAIQLFGSLLVDRERISDFGTFDLRGETPQRTPLDPDIIRRAGAVAIRD
jgi:hypothetical protein